MSVRPEPRVLWREGMFLCPHHLQAFTREIYARIRRGEAVGRPGGYGLVRLGVDEQALERDVFSIQELAAVLADGTAVQCPGNAVVDPREFAARFTGPELDVYLGVPAAQPNVPQVDDGAGERSRYRVYSEEVYDENLRDAPRELEFRQYRCRLFFGDEDRTGFDCIPIARLARHGKPVARTVPSPTYVPPLLACGASPVLTRELSNLAEMVRAQSRDLAARLPATAGLSSVEKGADIAGFVKLQAVNRSVAALAQIATIPELHPFDAYLWLVQTVGDLAIFGPDRVVPQLPSYDHARLDACFAAALEAARALIPREVEVPYDTAAFRKDELREGFFECELPREWLDRKPVHFFAVEIAKPAEEVVGLVASGVKLVAAADIERVLQGVVPGIGLTYERTPPLAFPNRPDLHFFRVETEGDSREAWTHVVDEGSLVLLSTLGALGAVGYHLYVELLG